MTQGSRQNLALDQTFGEAFKTAKELYVSVALATQYNDLIRISICLN